jgi:hypothetical protein
MHRGEDKQPGGGDARINPTGGVGVVSVHNRIGKETCKEKIEFF